MHEHNLVCYNNADMLICTDKNCNTVVKISDALSLARQKGEAKATREAYIYCLENHLLTRKGRKVLNERVSNHPLTRWIDLAKPRQVTINEI